MFANSEVFSHPTSRQQALGMDTRGTNALVDTRGNIIKYAKTGGMIDPQRYELKAGAILFRFASSRAKVTDAVTGGWWVTREEFEKMNNFADAKGIHVAVAARYLCCVPPEWSDMGQLLRAKVEQPLLAYRGLGNDVVAEANDGLGAVRMTAHNHIESRRLHQLYIPGLRKTAERTPEKVVPGALTLERQWLINEKDATRGWIYI